LFDDVVQTMTIAYKQVFLERQMTGLNSTSLVSTIQSKLKMFGAGCDGGTVCSRKALR
jgi:hypothetical protein